MKRSSKFVAITSGVMLLALGLSAAAQDRVRLKKTPGDELANRRAAVAQIDQLTDQMAKIIETIPALDLNTQQTAEGYKQTGERVIAVFEALNRYTENTATLNINTNTQLIILIRDAYQSLQQIAIPLMSASFLNAVTLALRDATGDFGKDDLATIARANATVTAAIDAFQLSVVALPVTLLKDGLP